MVDVAGWFRAPLGFGAWGLSMPPGAVARMGGDRGQQRVGESGLVTAAAAGCGGWQHGTGVGDQAVKLIWSQSMPRSTAARTARSTSML